MQKYPNQDSSILFKSNINKKTALFFASLLSVFSLTAQSTGKYSNEFLSIGIGAEALGLGNAVVANTNGVVAAYWNPAGLTQTDKWLDVGLMHSEYFAGIAKFDYAGIAHQIDPISSIALSAIRFAVDDIPNTTQLIDNNGIVNYDKISTFSAADYAFLFSYARKLKTIGWSTGGTLKIIHRKIGDFAKSWGFGIDAGIQYQKGKHWKFGGTIRDMTSTFNAWMFTLDTETKKIFEQTNNQLPNNGLELTLPRLILGAYTKYPLGNKGVHLAVEVNAELTSDGQRNTLIQSNSVSIDPKIGLEVGFKTYANIRMGLMNMQFENINDKRNINVQPNIGIGLNLKNIYIDYAFTDIGDASIALYSHVISLRITLDKPQKIEMED